MPYVKIPKDIAKVEPKSFFGMTKRVFIYLTIGILIGSVVIALTWKTLKTGSIWLFLLAITPFLVLAFYTSKYDRKIEDVFKDYIFTCFKSPKGRYFQIENNYKLLETEYEFKEVFLNAEKRKLEAEEGEGNKPSKKGFKRG